MIFTGDPREWRANVKADLQMNRLKVKIIIQVLLVVELSICLLPYVFVT